MNIFNLLISLFSGATVYAVSVMYAGIGIYVVYIIFLYCLGQKQLNKGVNVE